MTPVTEAELQAWVDGRLAPPRRADIESYLDAHPQEAQRLRAYRQQNTVLRARYNPVLDQAVPREMGRPPRRPWRLPLPRQAAALLIALAGGAAGWLLHGQYDDNSMHAALPGLVRQAALAHAVYSPEVRHPVEVGADQQEHLAAWLSKRLGKPLRPPRLAGLGYELVGGRLLPGEHGPVAQFMYQDLSGQRLTLYVSPGQAAQAGQDSAFRFARDGALSLFYWVDGSFGYALAGPVGKAELGRIAQAVYGQLQPP